MIPTRNRWPLLSRALGSVLAQEDVRLEVIVVDEGSTDATPERMAALEVPGVRHLRNDRPSGVARARNRGISEARGDWVAFLDDDDFWAPSKLRMQLAACDAERADFSYTGLVTTDSSLEPRRVSSPPPSRGLERALLGMNVIGPPSSVLVRRSLLADIGGFDPSFSILADWDLYIRLAGAGPAAACEEPLTGYMTHAANMHLRAPEALGEFRRLRTKHKAIAESLGTRFGSDRWWSWIAGSMRRSGHRFRGAALFLWVGLRYRRPHLVARAAGMLAGTRLTDRIRSARAGGHRDHAPPPEAAWVDALEESTIAT